MTWDIVAKYSNSSRNILIPLSTSASTVVVVNTAILHCTK